ncbi:hypothetical protein [Streptomyces sp. A1499]|uniref:hypothetical protein n=1 Tax=Streptomyces sp. A1499 TaxID=2563104 RepID=UPI00109E6057|nr:hypothetical protein E7X58_12000 [Streptomyces sp. A1499]
MASRFASSDKDGSSSGSGMSSTSAPVATSEHSSASSLCDRSLDDGCEVVCLDDFVTGSRANVAELRRRDGFRFIHGEATDFAVWHTLANRFDLVLLFACPTSPRRLPLRRANGSPDVQQPQQVIGQHPAPMRAEFELTGHRIGHARRLTTPAQAEATQRGVRTARRATSS